MNQGLEQRRIVSTPIPGPRSQELHARRSQEVARGFGVTLPVFVDRSDRGILLDVDGNQLIDFASGIAVTNVGACAPEVVSRVQAQVERFTHTCFMITEYDGYVDVAAALNRLTPGDHAKKTALFSTGAEAVDRLEEIVVPQIGAHNVAAIIIEPVQGEGGFIVPPEGYLPAVQEFATKHGIVFVADEIQSGFARTGAMFACDHEGVVPDMVLSAKALGGGLPLSAVTGRAELMDAVAPGGIGGTYAGNPVACAAALGAIEIIERDDLAGRARRIEKLAMPRLAHLAASSESVGEARGRGAMLALEFVEPGGTRPSADAAKRVAAACHAEGVLVLVCGTFGNVIRLLPPLVIDDELLDDALTVLEKAVHSL